MFKSDNDEWLFSLHDHSHNHLPLSQDDQSDDEQTLEFKPMDV